MGLTAAKMELDACALADNILGPALAANHKLGLAAGLLQVDDWGNASKLLRLLTDLKLDPMAFPPIASALCGLLRARLQPSMAALYPEGPRGLCILSRKARSISAIYLAHWPPKFVAVQSLESQLVPGLAIS